MNVQVFKQPDDGAIDPDGAPLAKGWYWVRMQPSLAAGDWIADGKCYGPFRNKRDAVKNAQLQTGERVTV
jgi:hypothetical protein